MTPPRPVAVPKWRTMLDEFMSALMDDSTSCDNDEWIGARVCAIRDEVASALSAARRVGMEECLAALEGLRLDSVRKASSHRAAKRTNLAEAHEVRVDALMQAEAAIRDRAARGGG